MGTAVLLPSRRLCGTGDRPRRSALEANRTRRCVAGSAWAASEALGGRHLALVAAGGRLALADRNPRDLADVAGLGDRDRELYPGTQLALELRDVQGHVPARRGLGDLAQRA